MTLTRDHEAGLVPAEPRYVLLIETGNEAASVGDTPVASRRSAARKAARARIRA